MGYISVQTGNKMKMKMGKKPATGMKKPGTLTNVASGTKLTMKKKRN